MKHTVTVMLFTTFCILCVVPFARAVDPNKRTSAGDQETRLQKGGSQVSVTGMHNDKRRGRKNFRGTANRNNEAQTGFGESAAALNRNHVIAGDRSRKDKFQAKGNGKGYTVTQPRGTADVDYSNVRNGKVFKPTMKAGSRSIDAELDASDSRKFVAAAKSKSDSNIRYTVDLEGGKRPTKAIVKDRSGNPVAFVDNLQNKRNIKVKSLTGRNQGSGTVQSQRNRNGVTENCFTNDKNRFSKHCANLKDNARFTEIQSGFVKTSAATRGRNEAVLSGSMIIGAQAVVSFDEAVESDCTVADYPDAVNLKYKEPNFMIDKNRARVTLDINRQSNTIIAKWPQCVKATVPITFPRDAEMDKLALAVSIYFPGCPRFDCKGRHCGNGITVGSGYGEACYTDNVCQWKPSEDRKKDIAGYSLANSETNLCNVGSLSGRRGVPVEYTFCPTEEARDRDRSVCQLLNFNNDGPSKDLKVVVIAKLYEKPAKCKGFACKFNLNSLLNKCDINEHKLVGCRKMGLDYGIKAFNFNADKYAFKTSGVNRKKGTSNGQNNNNNGPNTGTTKGRNTNNRFTTQFTRAPVTAAPWWRRWGSNG